MECAPLVAVGLVFGGIYLIGITVPEMTLRSTIADAGLLGPLAFVGLMLSAYVVAPMGNAPVLFAGFYAFGQAVVFYATVAALVAAVVNFWIGRKLGRAAVRRLVGEARLRKLDEVAMHHGLPSLIVMRILLGSMNELISYAAGLTSMTFAVYMAGTVVGLAGNALIWYLVALYASDPVAFTALSIGTAGALSTTFLAGSLVVQWLRAHRSVDRHRSSSAARRTRKGSDVG
jgi:uncharacterized membrane protein YdjX (TVP38/TMEM64 family)